MQWFAYIAAVHDSDSSKSNILVVSLHFEPVKAFIDFNLNWPLFSESTIYSWGPEDGFLGSIYIYISYLPEVNSESSSLRLGTLILLNRSSYFK